MSRKSGPRLSEKDVRKRNDLGLGTRRSRSARGAGRGEHREGDLRRLLDQLEQRSRRARAASACPAPSCARSRSARRCGRRTPPGSAWCRRAPRAHRRHHLCRPREASAIGGESCRSLPSGRISTIRPSAFSRTRIMAVTAYVILPTRPRIWSLPLLIGLPLARRLSPRPSSPAASAQARPPSRPAAGARSPHAARFGKQKALHLDAARKTQQHPLFLGLDPLDQHAHAECACPSVTIA